MSEGTVPRRDDPIQGSRAGRIGARILLVASVVILITLYAVIGYAIYSVIDWLV